MKNAILLGKAKEFTSMDVGQVWADANGKVGLILGKIPDAFMVQISESPDVIELVPMAAKIQFEQTCHFLGDLEDDNNPPMSGQ